MFFCEECRKKNGWPDSMSKSQGQCEVCSRNKLCYDVPSRALPVPKPPPPKTYPEDDRIDAIKYQVAAGIQINARTENSELRFEKARELARKVRLLEAKALVFDTREAMSRLGCTCTYLKKCEPCRAYNDARIELNLLEK